MYACHGLLSNCALKRINKSNFEKVIITNTVFLNQEKKNCEKIEVIDVTKLCAEVIKELKKGILYLISTNKKNQYIQFNNYFEYF